MTSGEERARIVTAYLRNVRAQKFGGGAKKDLLAPGAALQPADEQPTAREVQIAALHEQHLSHAQAVVVHEREEGPVAHVFNGREESSDFLLSQVARWALVREWLDGQRGKQRDRRAGRTAPISRRAQ